MRDPARLIDETMPGIARLVAPASISAFIDHIWQRAACHSRAALCGAPGWIDIDGFETLVARLGDASNGWLHLAHGEIRALPAMMLDAEGMVDLNRLRVAFARGYTLYLTKAERLDPVLSMWGEAIAGDLAVAGVGLSAEISAHLFLTPPRAQGFQPHRDAHASFVVQLEGSKHWLVYPPDPADNDPAPGPVARDALVARTPEIFRLEAGDVLFMPEWWPHEARAGELASLHVTFRLFPLPGKASPDRLRRQRVPKRVRAGRTFSQIGRLVELADDTPLMLGAEGRHDCFVERGCAYILFPGGELSGPEAFLPVFSFVLRNRRFRAIDLPELEDADYDRLALVQTLILAGLIQFADRAA